MAFARHCLVELNRLNQPGLNSEGYQPGMMVPACHKHMWNEVRIAMSVASLGYRARQQMEIKKWQGRGASKCLAHHTFPSLCAAGSVLFFCRPSSVGQHFVQAWLSSFLSKQTCLIPSLGYRIPVSLGAGNPGLVAGQVSVILMRCSPIRC